MASAAMAAMLDELMGRNRNIAPNDKKRQMHWSDDPELCRLYIVDFCPHELFTNTKADLGPCGKVHDDAMRKMYEEEKEDNYRKQQCADEFLRFCQRMLTDLQSRIRKSRERLALTQNPDALPPTATEQQREAHELMGKLTDRIEKLISEAEEAGCSGEVEEAQSKFDECEKLREEREQLRNLVRPGILRDNDFIIQAQQKAMEVCDICGAFLIVGDAQSRVDDHLMGKQHVGYARLRAACDRIVEAKRRLREERELERERRQNRDRDRDKEKESREGKSSSNGAEGGGGSGSSSKRRSRSRSPHRGSKRDRSDRSRSKERRRRSRSRSRERRRERKERERKRSRSRERRRSRSRERDRERRQERRRRSRSRSKERKH